MGRGQQQAADIFYGTHPRTQSSTIKAKPAGAEVYVGKRQARALQFLKDMRERWPEKEIYNLLIEALFNGSIKTTKEVLESLVWKDWVEFEGNQKTWTGIWEITESGRQALSKSRWADVDLLQS